MRVFVAFLHKLVILHSLKRQKDSSSVHLLLDKGLTKQAVKQNALTISGSLFLLPKWGAENAEIKFLSGENTKLKRTPFKAWSRSVHSHTCYAYCQGFLPCLFLPFRFIHLHFSKPLLIFPVLAVANTWFLCRPAE